MMLGIAIVLIGIFYLLSIKKPAVAVTGAMLMFGVEQWAQSTSSIFVAKQWLANVIFIALSGLALMLTLYRRQVRLHYSQGVNKLSIVLFFYVLMSFFWTFNQRITFDVWCKEGPYVLMFVFLCPLLINSEKDVRYFLGKLALMGTILILLICLTSEFTYRGLALSSGPNGLKTNPLELGTLGGIVGLAILLLNSEGIKRYLSIIKWAVFLGCIYVIVQSGSRGQFIALAAGLLIFYPISKNIANIRGFFLGSLGAITAGIIIYAIMNAYASEGRWGVENAFANYQESRFGMVGILLSYWLTSNPIAYILGLGNSASFDQTIIGFYPHFVPIEVLTEEGLVGFAIYIAIGVITFKHIVALRKLTKHSHIHRGCYALLGALCLYYLLISFKQGSLLTTAPYFMIAMILERYHVILAGNQIPFYDTSPSLTNHEESSC